MGPADHLTAIILGPALGSFLAALWLKSRKK